MEDNYKHKNDIADKVIGFEKGLSAFTDLETPAKKLIFTMSFDAGYEWTKSIEYRDFNFPNKAIHEATEYGKNHFEKYHKEGEEMNMNIWSTQAFGFLFGVYDCIMNSDNNM